MFVVRSNVNEQVFILQFIRWFFGSFWSLVNVDEKNDRRLPVVHKFGVGVYRSEGITNPPVQDRGRPRGARDDGNAEISAPERCPGSGAPILRIDYVPGKSALRRKPMLPIAKRCPCTLAVTN